MAKVKSRFFVTRKEVKVERLPWGPHDWLSRPDIVDAEKLLVVRVNMPRGKAQEFHKQPSMEEVIYILEGRAEQWVGDEVRILGPGDMAHIPMDVVHGTYNAGRGTLRFLSILGPARFKGPALVDVSAQEPWCSLREKRSSARDKRSATPASAPGGRRKRGSGSKSASGARVAGQKGAAGKKGGRASPPAARSSVERKNQREAARRRR